MSAQWCRIVVWLLPIILLFRSTPCPAAIVAVEHACCQVHRQAFIPLVVALLSALRAVGLYVSARAVVRNFYPQFSPSHHNITQFCVDLSQAYRSLGRGGAVIGIVAAPVPYVRLPFSIRSPTPSVTPAGLVAPCCPLLA